MGKKRGKSRPVYEGIGLPGRLSLSKKLLFSLVTVVIVISLLELGTWVVGKALPNRAWNAQRRHFATNGFPDLDELLVPDATRFWKLKPGLDRRQLTGRMTDFPPMRYAVSTDSRGFRITPGSNPAEKTILFLGDSSTFGMGVEDGQTIPARVQRALGGVQCINAGVPGYSAYQGRVVLEQTASGGAPDVVVITFGVNAEMQWDQQGDLEHARSIAREHALLINQSNFLGMMRSTLFSPMTPDRRDARPRLTDAEFEAQIRDMLRWCRVHGVAAVLVSWPQAVQMFRQGRTTKQLILERVARSEHVPLVDLVPTFRATGGTELFLDIVHPSPAGCETAARALLPTLKRAIGDSKARAVQT